MAKLKEVSHEMLVVSPLFGGAQRGWKFKSRSFMETSVWWSAGGGKVINQKLHGGQVYFHGEMHKIRGDQGVFFVCVDVCADV